MGRCSCLTKCLVDHLCCARPSPTPIGSSSANDDQNQPPSPDGSSNASHIVPSEPAFRRQTSLEELDLLLVDVKEALQSYEHLKQSPSNDRWINYRNKAETFMQTVDGLRIDLTHEAASMSKGLLSPLLNAALAGLGPVHWAAVGFFLVAWSLDTIDTSMRNWNDCFGLLRRIASLLEQTKEIWKGTNKENVEILQDCVGRSFQCAIICSSLIARSSLFRFLAAPTIKDSISNLGKELDRISHQIVGFAVIEMHAGCPRLPRQLRYASSVDIVGMREEREKAVARLSKDCSDLVAVCLHGMGGIGKTTIAQTILVEFQRENSTQTQRTYQCCRVELPLGIKVEELPKIQKQILDKICMHNIPEFFVTVDGREYLKMELDKTNVPVFLYLDNVLEPSHLAELLPEAPCFPPGSRILMTSRHEFVRRGIQSLKISDYELIEVKKLDKPLSKELLWRHVQQGQREPSSSEDQHWDVAEELETEVLRLCDGLPLALKVVGAYIAGGARGPRDVNVWGKAIEAMKKAEPLDGGGEDELRLRLKFSVDTLDKPTRSAFLDLVVFASVRTSWEEAEHVVSGRHLENLKERALVEKREKVEVHDVLKEMALRLAAEDEQEIRVTSQDALDEMSRSALEKVVALMNVKLDAHLLQLMPLLRFLVDVEILGECPTPAKLKHLLFVEITSATARPFHISTCRKLEHLSWTNRLVQDPYELEIFHRPDGVGGLMGLQTLDLGECSSLQVLPEEVGDLKLLRTLSLGGCSNLQVLPEGVGRLMGLRVLNLQRCSSVPALPEGVGRLTCLHTLNLGGCSSLVALPEGVGRLIGLRALDLQGCINLQVLPEGVGGLTDLRTLNLRGCNSLQALPEEVGGLTGLKYVDLRECSSLQVLPKEVRWLGCLRFLDLGGCSSLQALPEGVLGLTNLWAFDLSGCSSLKELPRSLQRWNLSVPEGVSAGVAPEVAPFLTQLLLNPSVFATSRDRGEMRQLRRREPSQQPDRLALLLQTSMPAIQRVSLAVRLQH